MMWVMLMIALTTTAVRVIATMMLVMLVITLTTAAIMIMVVVLMKMVKMMKNIIQ